MHQTFSALPIYLTDAILKGQFTRKSKRPTLPLTCRAVYLSRLLWSELSFGDISHRDVGLLVDIM